MHIHVESLTSTGIFHIGSALLAAAREPFGDLDSRITLSRAEDFDGFERHLADATVLLASEFVLNHPTFPLRTLADRAPKLRLIHLTNAGIEKLVPLDWLPGTIVLTNSSGAHLDKAREFAATAILALHARWPQMITNQRERRWEKVLTPRVTGRTLCVIGVGNVGRAFVEEGGRLGMRIVGVRRTGEPFPGVDTMYRADELLRAVADADMVVVSAPLTPDTRGLVDRDTFAAMKPGAAFINVGRARVVDYDALVAGLESGRISGAILDVFDPEPLPAASPLWAVPNLIMTPHVALDDSDEFVLNCLRIGFENVRRLINGAPLLNVVDTSHAY